MTQIRRDYDDLKSLISQLNNHRAESSILSDIEMKISWIRSELGYLRKLRNHDIEGISWAGLDHIEMNLERIETATIALSLSDV